MKKRYPAILVVLLFISFTGYSQEVPKKSKEERKLEIQKQTEELINSGVFQFIGSTAITQRGKSITITSGANSVSFSPDLVKSDLPFFGEAKTASAGFAGAGGYKFEGKPDEYKFESAKKVNKLKAVVKTGNESYTLNLTINNDGSANLSVFSINRSSMRYNGRIVKP